MSTDDYKSTDELKEEWRPVEGFEDKIAVSNMGRVMNLNYRRSGNRKIVPQSLEKKGYHKVSVNINYKVFTFKVHRLVANAFIPNPNGYKEVNHKDEDKSNNCVNNLEWCNTQYNCNYGTRNQRHSKPVVSIATDGSERYFSSLTKAARTYGSPKTKGGGRIASCINGECKSAFGYKWRFATEEEIKEHRSRAE